MTEPPPSYEFATGSAHPTSEPSPALNASSIGASAATSSSERLDEEPRGAAAYFASRPSNFLTHSVTVRPNTRRTEIAYPADWAPNRDVRTDDWSTFVEFLLPEWGEGNGDGKRLSEERIRHIEGVIGEWNQGFFQPRGVTIQWEDGMGGGGLRRSYAVEAEQSSSSTVRHDAPRHFAPQSPQNQRPPDAMPPPFGRQPQTAPSHSPLRSQPSTKHRLARKIKDVAKDSDVDMTGGKIRVGDMFSLDAAKGHLRIGKFALDQQGMNYDGRPIGPQGPPVQYHHQPYGPRYRPVPHSYNPYQGGYVGPGPGRGEYLQSSPPVQPFERRDGYRYGPPQEPPSSHMGQTSGTTHI